MIVCEAHNFFLRNSGWHDWRSRPSFPNKRRRGRVQNSEKNWMDNDHIWGRPSWTRRENTFRKVPQWLEINSSFLERVLWVLDCLHVVVAYVSKTFEFWSWKREREQNLNVWILIDCKNGFGGGQETNK